MHLVVVDRCRDLLGVRVVGLIPRALPAVALLAQRLKVLDLVPATPLAGNLVVNDQLDAVFEGRLPALSATLWREDLGADLSGDVRAALARSRRPPSLEWVAVVTVHVDGWDVDPGLPQGSEAAVDVSVVFAGLAGDVRLYLAHGRRVAPAAVQEAVDVSGHRVGHEGSKFIAPRLWEWLLFPVHPRKLTVIRPVKGGFRKIHLSVRDGIMGPCKQARNSSTSPVAPGKHR